jgi:porin
MKNATFWRHVTVPKAFLTVGVPTAILIIGSTATAAAQSTTGLLGDLGGVRPALAANGATLQISDSENLLGNVAGGVKTGATLEGATTADLQIDMGKAFNLPGGTFNITALQIHGRSLSPYYLDNLQAANGNEAADGTRLWELWYDQSFDHGAADVKIGQQSIDNEFITSSNSGVFVNTMAGWPLLPSVDLYAGGPAYPLASLGLRLRVKPADNQTILAGVFDDNPPGQSFDDDPQSADANGARFNLNTGALFIAEYQYVTNQPAPGQMVPAGGAAAPGLSGTYKIGFWYDTAAYPDQAFGTDGQSLASPISNGNPLMHHGNYSLYGVMDQAIWQPASGQTVNVFARVMGTPVADANLITFSLNGGLTVMAPFAARPNDTAGIDFGLGKVSDRAATLDRATALYTGAPYPVRGTEELFELTYQAQATPWLIVQPDLQYIVHPGAGLLNPDSTGTLKNELVVGVRTTTTF